MSSSVPNCASATCVDSDVLPSLGNGWESVFCICDGTDVSVCTPAPDFPSGMGMGNNHDTDAGLVGEYSTTWGSSSTSASTGGGATTWSSIGNAQTDNSSHASIALDQFTTLISGVPNKYGLGSEYIVLTDPGLGVPSGSTIVGIEVAIKAHSSNSVFPVARGGVAVFNAALCYGGTLYYFADPRLANSNPVPGAGFPPPNHAQSPYPTYYCFTQGNYPQSSSEAFHDVGFNLYQANNSSQLDVCMPVISDLFPIWNSAPVYQAYGAVVACDALSFPGHDVAKLFFLSTLKQSWSDTEVNDSSFGVALSFVRTTDSSGSSIAPTVFLKSVGIAVYYIPPGGGATRYQPNVCVIC